MTIPNRAKQKIYPILLTLLVLLCGTCLFAGHVQAAERLQPVGDKIVIVIDPGHGGENLGTQSGHTIEKVMTMTTAKAMAEELRQYDNVTVYLTHSGDKDMSLKERAQFAADVGADFLYSIHYNASENHTMFGTEVWVSCENPYNSYGYQFGYEHLLAMQEKGLFLRGVKTRKNKEGKDYYGIIRESAERGVPALIIEHCYVDEERDAEYIEDEESWKEFGRADALSVAKYFGLKSRSLGTDYSKEAQNLQAVSETKQVESTFADETKPDVCVAELTECDYTTGEVTLTISAADYDSMLLYYNLSIDGGQTWSRWETFPECNALTGTYTDTFQLKLRIPNRVKPTILVRVYNISDLYRESEPILFEQAFSYANASDETKQSGITGVVTGQTNDAEPTSPAVVRPQPDQDSAQPVTEPPEHVKKTIGTTTFKPADSPNVEEEGKVSLLTFLKICLVLVILLFFVVFISQMINYKKRKKRRRGRF